jgi:PRC-barrel domain
MLNKRVSASVVGLVVGMILSVAAISKAQAPDQRLDRRVDQNAHALKASELIGLSVRSSDDQEKGKIKDLFIAANGQVNYAVVSFGGFLGIGDKLFAVPLEALHFELKDNKLDYARANVTEETIKQRQGFENNNWPDHADRGFTVYHVGTTPAQVPAR